MKQNYNNKTKLRSAWFALVLLMLTALPITAQNAVERFQSGDLWYEVVDATKHTVKVTYANKNLDKAKARQQVLDDETTNLPNEWKGYNGTVPTTEKDEFVFDKIFADNIPEEKRKHKINVGRFQHANALTIAKLKNIFIKAFKWTTKIQFFSRTTIYFVCDLSYILMTYIIKRR